VEDENMRIWDFITGKDTGVDADPYDEQDELPDDTTYEPSIILEVQDDGRDDF
jgi:hypothetical protein